jgi:hypothetical protein
MISSILAFAAGLAAKIRLAPKSIPETAGKNDMDLAALLIAARIEAGKAEADRAEAMRALNATREMLIAARHARDDAKSQAQALREQITHALTRERAAQDRYGAVLFAVDPASPQAHGGLGQQPAMRDPGHSYVRDRIILDDPHSHVPGQYHEIPTPLGAMTLDRALRYVCTCVPGRADAFRNQQAQADD